MFASNAGNDGEASPRTRRVDHLRLLALGILPANEVMQALLGVRVEACNASNAVNVIVLVRVRISLVREGVDRVLGDPV